MTNKKSILFISHSAALYGAERSMLDLLLGLDKNAYEPVVVMPAEGPFADILRKNNIEVYVAGHQNWMGGKYFYVAALLRFGMNSVAFLKLKRWMQGRRFDFIYTNTSATPMGGLLAKATGLPHLWHIREFIPKGTGGKFYYGDRFSFSFIRKNATLVVCNSHQLAGEMKPYIPEAKLRVVHNGILDDNTSSHLPKNAPSRAQEIILGMVGSLGINKGIADGIQALRRLKDAGIRARLMIAGDGIEKNKATLRALAESEGVAGQIDWLGYVDDPSIVYKKAHLVLICSRWESFGRVAVEAGSWGCPVIATRRGGLLEVIEAEQTGLFYEPGDIEALSQHIIRFIDDPVLYNQISTQAIQSVHTRFTTLKYINNLETIFAEMPA